MAYVAITHQLHQDVRTTIRNKLNAELALLPSPPDTVNVPEDPALVALVWGEHLPLKDAIPINWMADISRVEYRTSYTVDGMNYTCSVLRELGPVMKGPPAHEAYSASAYGGRRFLLNVPENDPFVADMVAHHRQKREITNRWDKIMRDIERFLNSCKSVNEALKLWPDVRIYLPEHVLRRVEEKRAKPAASAAKEVLGSIDTSSAVAAAVGLELQTAMAKDAPQM